MKDQLAELPPGVRQMVDGQMAKTMERLEMLTSDGAIEAVVRTRIVGVNQGPPADWKPTGGNGR